jgi:hypothetical protein
LPQNPERPDPGLPRAAELCCHPSSPCPGVRSLQARIGFLDNEVLSLGFTLTGDLPRLRIPGAVPPARVDRLWEHTCFEAFLAEAGGEAYCEVNLAPSGAWATYRFPRYREGGKPAEGLEPRLVVHRWPDRLEVHALLRLDPALVGKPLRVGLAAVVEAAGGELSYWALRHPEGRPDFHHASTFTLDLAPEA